MYARRAIDAHQVRRAWAPGAINVHGAEHPRLSMNPFSFAARKVSSRTMTSSSSPSSKSGSAPSLTCGEATNARVFLGRTTAAGAISRLNGRWKNYMYALKRACAGNGARYLNGRALPRSHLNVERHCPREGPPAKICCNYQSSPSRNTPR
jgi:hypothetical protein